LLQPLLTALLLDSCQGAVASPVVWVTFASSVVTDLYLIMVPLPMLWGTSLRLVKKLAATFVLGAGVFVLVCSLLKTIFVTTVSFGGAIGYPPPLCPLGRASFI
jgi:hypothetical protein